MSSVPPARDTLGVKSAHPCGIVGSHEPCKGDAASHSYDLIHEALDLHGACLEELQSVLAWFPFQ